MYAPFALAPSSWASDYVGLPYIIGVGECAHRAALVWRQRFRLEIDVAPAFGDMAVAQRHILTALAGSDWARVGRPLEGDAVIMWKGQRLCHVGVWVAPSHVLHCTRAAGMILTPEPELPDQGFRTFGFFRHRARLALAA